MEPDPPYKLLKQRSGLNQPDMLMTLMRGTWQVGNAGFTVVG